MTRHDTKNEVWDPFGTLRRVLWIGGGQWCGKSTVARLLAVRHGLTAYHYDYHDARGHDGRRIARRVKSGQPHAAPAPITDSPRQMVVMVPTQAFRDRRLRDLARAATIGHHVSDPARAQQNRLERDRLVAEDAIRSAHRLGVRVIEVDGSHEAAAVADHFSPYLPPREHRSA